MEKSLLKYFAIFICGALIYGLIEVGTRGFTHISMGLLGGISMIIIHLTNDMRRNGLNYFIQVCMISLFITAIEFLTGEILNVQMHMNIWNYSDMPYNFDGQICLPFVIIWSFLSMIGIAFDDFLRYKMFKEDKNFNYLRSNKVQQT